MGGAPSWIGGDWEDGLTSSIVIASWEGTQQQPRPCENSRLNVKGLADWVMQFSISDQKTEENTEACLKNLVQHGAPL